MVPINEISWFLLIRYNSLKGYNGFYLCDIMVPIIEIWPLLIGYSFFSINEI